MDSNFKQVSYRGLDFYPEYYSSSTLHCNGGQYKYGDDGAWQDNERIFVCRLTKKLYFNKHHSGISVWIYVFVDQSAGYDELEPDSVYKKVSPELTSP